MNLKKILKVEYKRTNVYKNIVVTILLTLMLFVFFIGQLGQIELNNMLDIKGINNLIKVLSSSVYQKYLLTDVILGIGYFASIVIFSAFQGFPSCLNSYIRSRDEGSLIYLLIAPMKIKLNILGLTLFIFFKTLIMSLVPLLVICGFSLYCGASFYISFKMIITMGFILAVLFSSFLIINSLLWIFNGNQVIINIVKYIMLAFILLSSSLSTSIGVSLPKISFIGVFALLLYITISIVLLFNAARFFNKEKVVLNSMKVKPN